MRQPQNYGSYYWCIKVTPDLSKDSEIYIMADDVIIHQNGILEFIGSRDEGKRTQTNLSIAPGKWLAFYAASIFDGAPVAVEYWKGELSNPFDHDEPEQEQKAKERSKVNKSLRYDILKRDGFKCQLCGTTGDKAELVIDHIKPIAKGGKTELNNLQTLCQPCNAGKRDK